jgi:hypothetical protein
LLLSLRRAPLVRLFQNTTLRASILTRLALFWFPFLWSNSFSLSLLVSLLQEKATVLAIQQFSASFTVVRLNTNPNPGRYYFVSFHPK